MQPQYPAQYPPQPAAPPMPQYPPQQPYAQPQAPAYPQQFPQAPAYPQGYAQPPQFAPPQPPAQPLPTGTLDGFYQQPSSSGGPSWKFQDANRQPIIGKTCAGFVARPVTDADVRPQTDQAGNVRTYKDGRPKFVLVVPMRVQPDQEFPEGQAGWWVKGQARDELARAMAEAGAPAGAPEAGAFIQVTLVGTRPVPGMNPAFQYRIVYQRPQGAAPAQPAAQPVEQPVQQAPIAQPAPSMSQAMPLVGAPASVAQPAPQQMALPMPQQPAPAPVAQAAPAAVPAGFTPDQAALLAKLTGGQAQPPVPAAAG